MEVCLVSVGTRPAGLTGMRVRDLMQQEVRTIEESSYLDVVDELMREEAIRHLPVVSHGRLVGVVTQRDLLRAGISSALGAAPETVEDWLCRIAVRSIMTRELLTAHPDADLRHAVELMVRARVGCLPVVEDGKLVGLLTETDCLRHLAELLRSAETEV
jgi:CBS domain-containing protein